LNVDQKVLFYIITTIELIDKIIKRKL